MESGEIWIRTRVFLIKWKLFKLKIGISFVSSLPIEARLNSDRLLKYELQ